MKKEIMIQVENVTLVLGGSVIFENINFTVYENEAIVLIGPSGSGKTVLLKLLAGIYKPTQGRVLIHGEDWQSLESEKKHLLAKKIGMMFQQSALFDTLTALENVEFPIREHSNLPEDKIHSMSKEILTRVNLSDSFNKLPNQLSGGMQKRLAIARALVLNPEVIFYDDPVAGQDPIQSDQMSNLILEFKEKNRSTLVMATSHMRTAFKVADRIVMIINKQLLIAGTPEETKNHSDPRIQQFINGTIDGPIKMNAL